jgi:hypothetical protein
VTKAIVLTLLVLASVVSDAAPLCSSVLMSANHFKLMEKPVLLSTRFEGYAVSYPVNDAAGKPRMDLPLYHFRKNQNYSRWLKEAQLANPNVQVVHYPLTTEVNSVTKNFLDFFKFKENNEDKKFGRFFETIPSPELFEYLRAQWNQTHPDRLDVHNGFFRMNKGNGQAHMAKVWDMPDFQVAIGIWNKELGNDKDVPALALKGPNFEMNQNPEKFKPALEDGLSPRQKVLEDTSNLFMHDLGQWVNSLWVDKGTLDHTRKIQDFYLQVRASLLKNGKNLPAPLLPEVRPSLELGAAPKTGVYTTQRLLLDALHDSQRGLHSLTHMLVWLIRRPSGFVPGDHRVFDRGPIVTDEIRTHLQGMGVKPVGSGKSPSAEPNYARTWALAKESDKPFTLQDALDFVINKDRERAKLVGEALGAILPEVQAIYKDFESRGAFEPVSKEEIQARADEMHWRYEHMGN